MDSEEIIKRLSEVVTHDYVWPEVPAGWELTFIFYPDGFLDMDLLHPVSGRFWSEDNEFLNIPVKCCGQKITVGDLQRVGVPFMTTFGSAVVSDSIVKSHLSIVDQNEFNLSGA